ncbi:MAG TPA: dTDP-glucose 4,6-dehydratase [bacterium]|nr:dTDP-glucose 4,6-dehydratase [bacterium]
MVRTVVVTGGCGFIGSHFVRLLLRRPGWRVINFDNLTYAGNLASLQDVEGHPAYVFVRGDIADADAIDRIMKTYAPWAVVNFAAESHVDRSILDATPFLRTNILGVQTLLDAVGRHQVERYVQVSTDEVYGDAEEMAPFDEGAPLRPSSPYAASKAAADLLCLAYRRTHAAPVVIARSANNYGPFQFPEKLLPLMIRNALARDPLPIYGDGAQVRDWLHVEDNCAALLQVLERGQVGRVYNVATGEYRTNLEVVRAACRAVAAETAVPASELEGLIRFVADRPGHDRRYAVDAARIRSELLWRPETVFADGLRATVRWYLDHRDWIAQVTSGEYQRYYEAVYVRRWQQSVP